MNWRTSAKTLLIVNFLTDFALAKNFNNCFWFLLEILEFQKIVKIFTEKFDEISKNVEKEKMKVSVEV
jgi:hypothetical protein